MIGSRSGDLAYIVSEQLAIFISCIMQSPITVEAPPPVKRKYVKKEKPDAKEKTKKNKQTKWETDSAFIPDPTKEKPEPDIVEKTYVMNEGQWVEEEQGEKDAAIQALLAEVDKIPQIPSPPRAPTVDLLTCPFHLKPLTRKKPPDEIEKQEVLFCPDVDCPVFLFGNNLEAYLKALHYTAPSFDVVDCWDILQCYCSFTPTLKLSQSQSNPNRLYLSCNNFNKELRCPYFQWFDEPFTNKNAAWQDELRFEFKQLPVPTSREEAKRKEQENRELCRKMAHKDYFSNLKQEMEKKRKNLSETGCTDGWGCGGRARENGGGARENGGGGGPRKDPFIYYSRGVPSKWDPYASTDGGGAVLF